MGISFCIYRLISCQNIDYNYPIWDISARSGLLGVILSDGSFHFPPFFSLLMAAFRGRNQRLIQEMHPTLDDSRVSSTMQGSVPKYRKTAPEARSLHIFASHPWSFEGGKWFKYSILSSNGKYENSHPSRPLCAIASCRQPSHLIQQVTL